jgi:hypothetical protein
VCPSQLKISCLPTKEEGKEGMDALVTVERGTLWRIVETRPHPSPRRRHARPKPTQQSRLG